MGSVGPFRLRATVLLVSLVTITVEIALMRELALRFWEHLAWLVISIALLGFGISGTVLVLLQKFSRMANPSLQFISLQGLALSIPLCLWVGDVVNLDLLQMVWQPTQIWRIGLLELVFALPFICGGMFIGTALQDDPSKVPGHYGASFIGSGLGGIVVLPALFVFSPRQIMLGGAVLILAASLSSIRSPRRATGGLIAVILLAGMIWQLQPSTPLSDDKDLPQLMAMPESVIVASRSGPQGTVQVVQAPSYHGAPGLSLVNTEPLPDQLLVTIDGHIGGRLYIDSAREDFAFLDNTTMALPYRLLDQPSRVLIGPEAGTDQIGLALYHDAGEVTALADNSTLARLKSVDLTAVIGDLYRRPEVSFHTTTLRGYLHDSGSTFSLIDLPMTGADFGGLTSAATSPLFTLETFSSAFDRLEETGVLSVTTHAHVPPRESLRLLNMFVELLNSRNLDPRTHIVVIRSWATVTLAAAKTGITVKQTERIRSFCQARGFDLVWLPDLLPTEVNTSHVLTEPQYYLGAVNLLGAENSSFVARYIYDLSSPTDDSPFFHHFSRLDNDLLAAQLGNRGRSYAEIGTLLLIAALGQAAVLALVLIVLPMLPVVGLPAKTSEQLVVIFFFGAIGCGFMLLEMGFLQRLEVYLGHPVYAASAVLSGFLFFGGLGSITSSKLSGQPARQHCLIGLAIAALTLLYLLGLDTVLDLTVGLSLAARLVIVLTITGPLALLMGMMFPLGLKRLGSRQSKLIPWAWSINGFTSVLAVLTTPLLAMHWGFATVGWSAAVCYGLAAVLSLGLPSR